MPANTDKLVKMDILDYYDTGIKQWVIENIEKNMELVFDKRENFPTVGQDNIIYIDGTNLYIYSEESNDYQLVNSGSGTITKPLTWGTF